MLVDAVRLHLSHRRELRSVLSEEVLACNFLDSRAEVGHVRELHVVHDIVSSLGTLVQEQFVLSHRLLAALRVFHVLLAQVQRQRPDFWQLKFAVLLFACLHLQLVVQICVGTFVQFVVRLLVQNYVLKFDVLHAYVSLRA